MQVSSVNNVSFSGKQKKVKQKKDKSQYYKWVSQNQANNALKMSLGREVEDGKYKAASAACILAGFTGTIASTIAKTNAYDKVPPSGPTPLKAIKQNKFANIGFIASGIALLASYYINQINEYKADKTANERGFLSTRDRMKINDAQVNYAITDDIYNAHVN